jgi:hypothetical protein
MRGSFIITDKNRWSEPVLFGTVAFGYAQDETIIFKDLAMVCHHFGFMAYDQSVCPPCGDSLVEK